MGHVHWDIPVKWGGKSSPLMITDSTLERANGFSFEMDQTLICAVRGTGTEELGAIWK
jgi:hypothetical protein